MPYWKLSRVLPNKENQDVVNDFLLHLKLANRSEQTIISYRGYLEEFFRDMHDAYSTISSETILRWFQMNKSHLKESSYKQNLCVISSFYNFCVQEALIERTPIKKRWFPRPPKAVPKYLEKGEIAKVRQASERTILRNRALVEFMLTSGCRVGEVHSLNVGDVDLENRTARVVGKGKKIRNVHFSEKSALLLERYLDGRDTREDSPLFTERWSESRLKIEAIREVMHVLGEKAGLIKRLNPHRLRHTFATELLAKGAELSFISEELGHADISTTQIYARLPNSVMISEYRKYMG